MEKLASILGRLRKENGFSLREAASAAKLTPSYLLKLERGVFSTITVQAIARLASAYRAPISLLLEEAEFVEESKKLPEFAQYLRLKYRLTNQAIKDMEIVRELVVKKYG